MKNMLASAITLCATAHQNQFDKGGYPYALHPLKVMHYLKTDDMELMCIAVLHDVVEDTKVTFSDLKHFHGMSDRVIAGIRALTKMPGQTHEEYLEGIKANPDAIKVKMCDLRHNMDIRRLKGVSEKDTARLAKYSKMYTELKGLV